MDAYFEADKKLWTRSFVSLAVANLLMAIAFYFMLPILPVYLKDIIGATKSEIGVVLSFYTIAALAIRLFAGWALDVYGRKLIYLTAFLLFSIFFIGYPIAFTFIQFLFLRFAHGLTWGVLTTSGSTIAVDIIPQERRGEGIGIFGLSMTIGMALGPTIAIFIAGDSQYSLLFFSAIAISLVGLVLAYTVKLSKFTKTRSKKFSAKDLVEKTSIPVAVNMILVMFTYGGVLSFISLYGKEIGVSNSGLFFLLLSIGIGLSRVLSGKVFDLYGPRLISVIGMILLAIGFPILGYIDNPIGYHISAIILGFGFGIIMPTFQAMVNNMVNVTRRGAANSTFFTAFDLGIGFGMIGTGILSQLVGFNTTFSLFAIIVLLALTFFLSICSKYYHNSIAKQKNN